MSADRKYWIFLHTGVLVFRELGWLLVWLNFHGQVFKLCSKSFFNVFERLGKAGWLWMIWSVLVMGITFNRNFVFLQPWSWHLLSFRAESFDFRFGSYYLGSFRWDQRWNLDKITFARYGIVFIVFILMVSTAFLFWSFAGFLWSFDVLPTFFKVGVLGWQIGSTLRQEFWNLEHFHLKRCLSVFLGSYLFSFNLWICRRLLYPLNLLTFEGLIVSLWTYCFRRIHHYNIFRNHSSWQIYFNFSFLRTCLKSSPIINFERGVIVTWGELWLVLVLIVVTKVHFL